MAIALPFLVSLVLALALVPLCRGAARRWGFVAKPREDRWHKRPVAMFGGVGIAVSFFASALLFGTVAEIKVLLVTGVAIFILGLADDLW